MMLRKVRDLMEDNPRGANALKWTLGIGLPAGIIMGLVRKYKNSEWLRNSGRVLRNGKDILTNNYGDDCASGNSFAYNQNSRQEYQDSTDRTAELTARKFVDIIERKVAAKFDCTWLVEKLQRSDLTENERNEASSMLIITSFSKLIGLIYAECMQVTLLRIQMNILGARLYQDRNGVPSQTRERFLRIHDDFCNHGLDELLDKFYGITACVLGEMSVSDSMEEKKLKNVFRSVRESVKRNYPILLEMICDATMMSRRMCDDSTMAPLWAVTIDSCSNLDGSSAVESVVETIFSYVTGRIAAKSFRPGHGGGGGGAASPTRLMHVLPQIDNMVDPEDTTENRISRRLLDAIFSSPSMKVYVHSVYEALS